MYGAIVAAMLTTTAPAAPDWGWWGGFGCSPWGPYPNVCGGYYCYPWYAWTLNDCPDPASDGGAEPGAREKALEGQIRELREEMRRLQGGKPMNEEVTAPTPARVVVKLPADARLFIDDDPCPLASNERSFDTPDLRPGVTYHYTVRAEVTRAGRPVTETKRVTVRAGQETVVEFGGMGSVEAASR
jgi:uncharacterized protein (TIGR03000 family)